MFVVRPSGGSLYLEFRLHYELPPEGRTTNIELHSLLKYLPRDAESQKRNPTIRAL